MEENSNKMEKKDYSYRVWLLVLAVIISMAALSFVPSFGIFGLTAKKMDILSDLRDKSEVNDDSSATDYTPDFQSLESQLSQTDNAVADSLQKVAPIRYEWIVASETKPKRIKLNSEDIKPVANKHQILIEDFDTAEVSRLDRFINKLVDGKDVRIAFLGDSFIEGDIITVDMREQLQRMFGGRGVGYVPCALPFEIFRTSIKTSSSGLSSYSLLNQSATPAAYRGQFFMSGYLSVCRRGATVRWQTTNAKSNLNPCSRARVFVTSRSASSVELTVNDTLRHKFDISGADYVRELYVEAPLTSVRLRVLSGEVICHGASLEGSRGVMVDNMSIRGNSGHTIFGSSVATNTQIDKMLGYDLIVLEYGLNAMQPGQRNFSKYKQKLCDMIRYCKRCFPNAAIMVLGVSDRAVKGEGGWKSINSVGYLGPVQRGAAKESSVCFWDMGKLVMSYGGINGFVKNGWAAGDHIHINFKGGARIAESLSQAIQQRAYEMLRKREGKAISVELPISLESWKFYAGDVSVEDLYPSDIPVVVKNSRPDEYEPIYVVRNTYSERVADSSEEGDSTEEVTNAAEKEADATEKEAETAEKEADATEQATEVESEPAEKKPETAEKVPESVDKNPEPVEKPSEVVEAKPSEPVAEPVEATPATAAPTTAKPVVEEAKQEKKAAKPINKVPVPIEKKPVPIEKRSEPVAVPSESNSVSNPENVQQ